MISSTAAVADAPDSEQASVDWSSRDTVEGRNAIVEHYYEWSQQLAGKLISRLPTHIDANVLRSAAGYALLDCVKRFEPDRGLNFKTFASWRIRGELMDALRAEDCVSRQTRYIVKLRESTERLLMAKLRRPPTQEEVCEHLDWAPKVYLRSLAAVNERLEFLHRQRDGKLKCISKDHGQVDPAGELDKASDFDHFMRGFSLEEKTIIYLLYYRDASMKKVGEALGTSESRISQMHSAIIDRLRKYGRTPS